METMEVKLRPQDIGTLKEGIYGYFNMTKNDECPYPIKILLATQWTFDDPKSLEEKFDEAKKSYKRNALESLKDEMIKELIFVYGDKKHSKWAKSHPFLKKKFEWIISLNR